MTLHFLLITGKAGKNKKQGRQGIAAIIWVILGYIDCIYPFFIFSIGFKKKLSISRNYCVISSESTYPQLPLASPVFILPLLKTPGLDRTLTYILVLA